MINRQNKARENKYHVAPFLFYSIFLLVVISSFPVKAQSGSFKTLNIYDGLSQNTVLAVMQDSKGFMWFGTKDGLNRYDGYSFRVYRHNPMDTTSVSCSYITCLFEDRSGLIWVGTHDGGLNVFDRESGVFYPVKLGAKDKSGESVYSVQSIAGDKEGKIWVGTNGGGLFRLNIEHKKKINVTSVNFVHDPADASAIGSNLINDLHFDSQGILWIGTRTGLSKLDLKSGKFTNYEILTKHYNTPENDFQSSVSTVYETKNGTMWLGALSGLVKFNKLNGKYELYAHRFEVQGYGLGNIVQITEDQKGFLWLANAAVLMQFDTTTNTFSYFNHDPVSQWNINFNSISSLFIDKTQLLWIGTTNMGISIYDLKANRFPTLKVKIDPSSLFSNFSVWSVLDDDEGNVWIGSDVLYKWNRKTGKFHNFNRKLNQTAAFGSAGIWSMIKTPDGTIWTATNEGISRYFPSSTKVTYYKFEKNKKNGLPQKEVYCVFKDQDQAVWVATGNFLCKCTDTEKGTFRSIRYSYDQTINIQDRPVIFQDKNKSIWLGTKDGLLRLNSDYESFHTFKSETAISDRLFNFTIHSICADPLHPDTYFWIGSTRGLSRFDIKKENFVHVSEQDGLANTVVYGISHDEENNLWLSTNKGVTRFNLLTGVFRNFDVHDGLESNEFNAGAYFRSKIGELFFGGMKGLNYFKPDEIYDNLVRPEVVLTKIKLGDRSISHKTDPGLLRKSISETSSVSLSYNDKVITFEYAALDFSNPEKNQYAHRLENFDDDWIFTGSVRSATYTNLSPGKYVFRAKASNSDGIWNENGLAVKLIISPPWWRSWWLYLLVGLLIISVLYFIRHSELNRLKLKTLLELEKVDSDTLRNIDQMRSRFFANISHEFRTPLTLILGQIENVMSSGIDRKEKTKLQVAQKNSHRLLTLINQLLDLSKLEAGNMVLSASQHNVVSFLKSLFFSFESLAAQKEISLLFESDPDNIPAVFDPEKLEKVIYNLVSNAIKFTGSNGEVKVKIQLTDPLFFEIRIEDDGPGIPEDQLLNIFDRFYQVDSSNTRRYDGSGIGLALTKELVELHKGTIIADSREGEGTVFIIRLPLGEIKPGNDINENTHENRDFSIDGIIDTERDDAAESDNDFSSSSYDQSEIILIVEDNKAVRAFIREQLEKDYQVIEADDGEEGILRAKEAVPDLIITDLMMPKLDGYGFCREIRRDELTSHIPLIMLTAKAGFDDKIEGLETGVDDYITKPFSPRELKVRVRNLILQRKQLRKRFSSLSVISPDEVTTASVDQVFLDKVLKTIESHFEDQHFTIESLAKIMNMSVSQLNRKLNALIDQPAGKLMRSLCLQRAADLLKSKAGTVAGICYQLGFTDQAYFSRAFKKQFGCSPTEYLK